MSRQRSLEQDRAKAAWDRVTAIKDQRSHAGKYGQLARRGPADIQSNGLGQTLAFWNAQDKDKAHFHALLMDVSDWVGTQIKFTEPNLLEWIVKTAGTNEYRRATTEAIAFLSWVKRFAEAELPKEND
jgi:CRISPR-associated protein Cmr5